MRQRAILNKHFKERAKVKKISIILAVALTLVFAFAANAMATQTLKSPMPTSTDTATASIAAGTSDYAATATGDTAVNNAMNKVTGVTGNVPNSQNRIHSHYTANTNACAACHAVHTGVGAYLLQWGDGQATCEACHDGTTNTYDVFGGQIGKNTQVVNGKTYNVMTYGGRFDVHDDQPGTTHDASSHNISGSVKINAAPGGIMATDATDVKNKPNWGDTFECLSCHDAHGKAGNFRLLSPDVNNYPNTHAVTQATSKIVPLNASDLTTWVAVTTDNTFDWINVPGEYPYKNDAFYVTSGGVTTKKVFDQDYTFDNASGFTKIVFRTALGASDTVKADYHPGLKVTGVVSNYLQATEQVQHQTGINDFCGACHVDYNTKRVNYANVTDYNGNANLFWDKNQVYNFKKGSSAFQTLSGTYHAAYRHQVGFINHAGTAGYGTQAKGIDFEYPTTYDQNGKPVTTDVFTCLSCHVSHGTDTTVWNGLQIRDSAQYLGDEKGTLGGYKGFDGNETNPAGSKLTRMPGFGVCITCHNKVDGNQGMAY